MILKKLIIYEFDTLFSILNEINENLNFELIKSDKKNFQSLKKDLTTDYLILSKYDKTSFVNQLVLPNLPIKINKLIELINIEFLKNHFNIQSNINVGGYILNLNSREITKNNKKLDLTERETNLIIYLNKSQIPISIGKLQKEVWEYGNELETHTVETHIYRLRKKIKDKFDDDKFIVSLKNGYKIN